MLDEDNREVELLLFDKKIMGIASLSIMLVLNMKRYLNFFCWIEIYTDDRITGAAAT